ncbi:MAG: hypothetical protein RML40_08220 [Bacteroidota bacterium]|nr:hypothetical protein [Candidatus Kapabacteria bacterium]MDW8220500.1 hypothetical protein [Bacteroidota bacterium]
MLLLSHNRFEGVFQSIIAHHLQELGLNANMFKGSSPESIGRAARLRVLRLERNAFERLPVFLAPQRLDTMCVDSNRLEFGSLEANIGHRCFAM